MSPNYTPDHILKQFPPTRIYVAEIDPLRDYIFSFALKLKKLGNDCKVHLFKEYIHGFCQLDDKNLSVEEHENARK